MIKGRLQTKVFITYLIMIFLVAGAFSVFFYQYTAGILIERETKSAANLNASFIAATDQILTDMDTVCINIGYSNLIKDVLDNSTAMNPASAEFKDLVYLLSSINGADLKVYQINLYSYHGKRVQVGVKSNISDVDVTAFPWAMEVQKNGGSKTISMPYLTTDYATIATYQTPQWYISLYRCCINQYKKETGIIETVQKCDTIFKYALQYERRNEHTKIYIYSDSGALVYPYDSEKLPPDTVPDYFSAIDRLDGSASLRNPVNGAKELLVSGTSDYNGWTYVTVQPERNILMPVYDLLKLLGGVMFVIILTCIAISYHFSVTLVRPIRQLRNVIKETTLHTLDTQDPTTIRTSVNELEELKQAFAQMGVNLKASMNTLIETQKQELKSRSLALQSQINPHFYYNTLSNIIVLAENNQSGEVIAMCRNLTKIMRYITENNPATVTLGDEINYIRQYLYCMKVRYQSSLNYHIDVDPVLSQEPVPRLIIQPLVENGLKYGISGEPPWHLTITSEHTDEFWKIIVTDSGGGFLPDRIKVIDERIRQANDRPGMPEMQIDGLGLLNVYLRWKLHCKEQMIFEYGNTEDGHGQVSIGKYKPNQFRTENHYA